MKTNKFLWTITIVFILISNLTTPALAIAGDTTLVSASSGGVQGNSDTGNNFISPDGRYIGLSSYATNLVSGDTNAKYDVFVRDLLGGTTTRVQ